MVYQVFQNQPIRTVCEQINAGRAVIRNQRPKQEHLQELTWQIVQPLLANSIVTN
jgi:hypothetical protein